MLDKIIDLLEYLEKRYNIPFDWLIAITAIIVFIVFTLIFFEIGIIFWRLLGV